MAVNYDDLFQDLGKLVKHYNLFTADAQALAADMDEILDEFQDTDQDVAAAGLTEGYEGWESQYAGRKAFLAAIAEARLLDRTTVAEEVGAKSNSISDVLFALIDRMTTDSETVKETTVSFGSVAAAGTGGGSEKGTVLRSIVLDGVQPPGAGVLPHRAYKSINSYLTVAETIHVECIGDSFEGGVTEGAEQFRIYGDTLDPNGVHGTSADEGSGDLGSITAVHSEVGQYIDNPDFEDFAVAHTPDSWTLTGTAGTHIAEDASSEDYYHGTSSIRMDGNGSTATIKLSQAIDNTKVIANQMYVVTARYKASASISAGTFTVQFSGTGYTPGATEKSAIAPGALATSWTLIHFFVVMPGQIPSDFALDLQWTGTPTTLKSLWIDDIGMKAADYRGGHAVAVVRGSNEFQVGDRYSYTVTPTEGVFSKFFRKVFRVQLPGTGSPTNLDSWAG